MNLEEKRACWSKLTDHLYRPCEHEHSQNLLQTPVTFAGTSMDAGCDVQHKVGLPLTTAVLN